MVRQIILASKSKVRKEILNKYGLSCEVQPSNVDEDIVKESLEKQKASPEEVSKNLAELKANKVSQKFTDEFVIGADSVIDLKGKVVSKPTDRDQAYEILKNLNGETHYLISSVCISKGGNMIWNFTDRASLTMKSMTEKEMKEYLSKISDEALYAYNVYQIEGLGRSLFSKIEGNENTIMGLPIEKIKDYLKNYNV
jgi:septum formation protein